VVAEHVDGHFTDHRIAGAEGSQELGHVGRVGTDIAGAGMVRVRQRSAGISGAGKSEGSQEWDAHWDLKGWPLAISR
jgi:hypothetical protein